MNLSQNGTVRGLFKYYVITFGFFVDPPPPGIVGWGATKRRVGMRVGRIILAYIWLISPGAENDC